MSSKFNTKHWVNSTLTTWNSIHGPKKSQLFWRSHSYGFLSMKILFLNVCSFTDFTQSTYIYFKKVPLFCKQYLCARAGSCETCKKYWSNQNLKQNIFSFSFKKNKLNSTFLMNDDLTEFVRLSLYALLLLYLYLFNIGSKGPKLPRPLLQGFPWISIFFMCIVSGLLTFYWTNFNIKCYFKANKKN